MNDFDISRSDSQAICKEIGERLQDTFTVVPLPNSLRLLMDELAKVERVRVA
jgi:hypothetical protein